MRITLTPGQAVYIHGWLNPRTTLSWADVLAKDTLTLRFLAGANVTLERLHHLQPDGPAWVQAQRAGLDDCPAMREQWRLHPLRDFGADLGDLINARWPPELMASMGLTYSDFLHAGLTPATMALCTHVTLAGWVRLGFKKEHAAAMHEASLVRLFGMTKQDILRGLPT